MIREALGVKLNIKDHIDVNADGCQISFSRLYHECFQEDRHRLCDLIFMIRGKKYYYCHQLVFRSRCKYFEEKIQEFESC